jgi:hypothetical protein
VGGLGEQVAYLKHLQYQQTGIQRHVMCLLKAVESRLERFFAEPNSSLIHRPVTDSTVPHNVVT